jgi:hypothetical protein
MKVTPDELRTMASENEAWHNQRGEHPTAFISDDLFDRILDDLHTLAASEAGQGSLFDDA